MVAPRWAGCTGTAMRQNSHESTSPCDDLISILVAVCGMFNSLSVVGCLRLVKLWKSCSRERMLTHGMCQCSQSNVGVLWRVSGPNGCQVFLTTGNECRWSNMIFSSSLEWTCWMFFLHLLTVPTFLHPCDVTPHILTRRLPGIAGEFVSTGRRWVTALSASAALPSQHPHELDQPWWRLPHGL
jgi:hypothetical protein